MTRRLTFSPSEQTSKDRADILFAVAVVGGDALEQKGQATIRQRGRIMRLIKSVGELKENAFVLRPDATVLDLSQEDHTYLDKCWGAYKVPGLLADKFDDALNWFEAAEKVDPSAKAEPKE